MPDKANIKRAMSRLENHLTSHGWEFFKVPDVPIYVSKYHGDSGVISCSAKLIAQYEQFIFEARSDIDIPEDRYMDIISLMNRVNYSVNNGSFALDIQNGEVLFKDSVAFVGTNLSDAQIGYTISIVIQTIELCVPVFSKVISSEMSVSEAFDVIDSNVEAV